MTVTCISIALLGGILIGAAASGLLLVNGQIAGISGILAGLLAPSDDDAGWRIAFVGGLLTGGALLLIALPAAFPAVPPHPLPRLAIAGLLVGLGTRISGGCTSGHGVCGLSRRSPRSLAATLTFMATGMATVFVVAHLWGRS